MGLMDKVRAQATQIAQKTQETARDSKIKFDQAQAKRRGDIMLRNLGAVVYADRTGRGTGDSAAEIDRLVTEIASHEAEHEISLAREPADTAPDCRACWPQPGRRGRPIRRARGRRGRAARRAGAREPPAEGRACGVRRGFPAVGGFPPPSPPASRRRLPAVRIHRLPPRRRRPRSPAASRPSRRPPGFPRGRAAIPPEAGRASPGRGRIG